MSSWTYAVRTSTIFMVTLPIRNERSAGASKSHRRLGRVHHVLKELSVAHRRMRADPMARLISRERARADRSSCGWSVSVSKASNILGSNIADERKAQGMTQEDLALKAGLDCEELARIEAGMSDPRIFSTVARIAYALDVELPFLLRGM